MAETNKPTSNMSADNAIRSAFNQEDASLTMGMFITASIGNKIVKVAFDSVTDDISYYNGVTLLYTLRVIYTSSLKDDFSSMERIA